MKLINAYQEKGIYGVLGLRGDAGIHERGIKDSVRMLKEVRKRFSGKTFCAGYPEPHPETKGEGPDEEWLRKKLDCGVDEIITQYCFDHDAVFRFRDLVKRLSPTTFIRIGVLPIRDPDAMIRFSQKCGASVPASFIAELNDLKHDKDALYQKSAEQTRDMINKLAVGGIEGVHIYTLNSAMLSELIFEPLRID